MELKVTLRQLKSRWAAAAFACIGLASNAIAALPQPGPGGAVAADGDYFAMIRDYMGQGFGLGALAIVGICFIVVGGGCIYKFNEWRTGKGEAGDLKMAAVLGVITLALVVFFANQAAELIPSAQEIIG